MCTSSAVGSGLFCVALVFAQQATLPTFDVASVKPSKANDERTSWHTGTGSVAMRNQTLQNLVAIAYHVPDDRVSGGPAWIGLSRFDIDARAASPAQEADLLLMLRALLAERFQLALHREPKPSSGFSLAVSKNERLNAHRDDTEGKSGWNGGQGKVIAQRMSMAKLAEVLTRMLVAPVVDMTDAKGLYSFNLEWTSDNSRSQTAADGLLPEASSGPSLFTALQRELGIKLEAKRLPIEVLVIDKAERPTEN
jgi:uncharacterized protein (TIGR03435 family)